ncbi:ABC transporter permease subunit [uncultured Actinomyces sp.]|mgnify:FL=1|jgi:proline/glycine betaine ABC transporter, permease protein|uniref:ABC transporter permease n=1 Tax=uncultured Actinomyces sp. TaxID=249061 RepID=UPI0028E5DB69|nr:ABC transporter permease subunit [uncultured Actinomyces sp.]
MSIFLEALSWLTTPANWLGGSGILTRSAEHLGLTLLIVVLAALVALPLGTVIGHTGRGRWLVSATGAARAIPTLGVLTLAGLWLGIGLAAPTLALLVLAVPPLLSATYSGIASTPRTTVDAARAIGLTESQILAQVEVPHAAGLVAAGVRSATLQVIATTTLAAYTANYGLGRFLYTGLKTRDYAQMIGGAIVVVALALATDALLAFIARRLRDRTHSFSDEEKNSLKESL